jgi:hypothetical protein
MDTMRGDYGCKRSLLMQLKASSDHVDNKH